MAMDNAKMNKAGTMRKVLSYMKRYIPLLVNFTCPVCCYSGAYALFSNSHRTRN